MKIKKMLSALCLMAMLASLTACGNLTQGSSVSSESSNSTSSSDAGSSSASAESGNKAQATNVDLTPNSGITDSTVEIPESNYKAFDDEFKEYVATLFNVDDYNYTISSSTYEYESSDIKTTFGDKIKFETGTVTLPAYYADYLALGFTTSNESHKSTTNYDEEILQDSYGFTINMYYNGEETREIGVEVVNASGEDAAVTDEKVKAYQLKIGDTLGSVNENITMVGFELENGINNNSTIEDVIKAFGSPKSITYSGQGGDTKYASTITLKYQGNKISRTLKFIFAVTGELGESSCKMIGFDINNGEYSNDYN